MSVQEGGDPACWVDRVCVACGRLGEHGDSCPACGTPLGVDDHAPVDDEVIR